jgi:hypothetical protein
VSHVWFDSACPELFYALRAGLSTKTTYQSLILCLIACSDLCRLTLQAFLRYVSGTAMPMSQAMLTPCALDTHERNEEDERRCNQVR